MVKFLKLIVVIPIAAILLAFAIANRHYVTVSFDPFDGNDIGGPQFTAPLFLALFLSLMAGVVIGGTAVWMTQGRNRRAARLARTEAEQLRAETIRLRGERVGNGDGDGGGRALVRADLR